MKSMKTLKLAILPMAMMATSAFAAEQVVAVETAPVAVTTTSYNTATPYDANTTVINNTTTQVVDGTKTVISTITHPAAVSAEVGTLGYGANIAWGVNDKTELVAGWTGGDISDLTGNDFKARGVKYDVVKSDFSNPYVGVQMRPASNWFTVGTGVIFPDNEVKVKTTDTSGTFKINGKQYKLANGAGLEGTIDHRNEIAPFLTVGFHPNINNHWGLFGDIGAAYMGKTDVNIKATGNKLVVNQDGSSQTLVNGDDVARQAEVEIKDKDWGEWYPIVKVGATYRF